MEEKGDSKTGIAYYDKNGVVQSVNETTGKPRSELEKNLTEVEFKYNNLDDMFDKAETAATAHKNLLDNPPPSMGSPEQIAEAKEFARVRAEKQKQAEQKKVIQAQEIAERLAQDKTADVQLPNPSVTPAQQQPVANSLSIVGKPAVADSTCYSRLDKKYDDINSALKDCTLVKENGTYHIKNATTKSDIIVNQDGSMRGETYSLHNENDPKVIADKISADLVTMAKVHQASGSTEPFHLVVIKGENLSDEQSIKMMQIEKLVQHNLEREFNTGNKNGLDKSKFTFAGKPIPPLAPPVLPVAQKAAIAASGNTTPKRDEGIRPHR